MSRKHAALYMASCLFLAGCGAAGTEWSGGTDVKEGSEGGRFERDSCVSKSEKNRLRSAAISSKLKERDCFLFGGGK